MAADPRFMARAIELAEKGRGYAAPNPCVGAVLARGGQIVAEGWHTACGRPHAERECLADAREKGVDPRDCAMYVTLEPCNHHGRTPPCTEAILEAGVPEVFVGAMDPNPRVEGGGADFLRQKGVNVYAGIMEDECLDLIADFRTWMSTKRPYVMLKLAATLDGKIAGPAGKPEAVSSPESREDVQNLRFMSQAVMVGGNTLRNDNPRLTVRRDDLPEDFKQPLAVVVTRNLPPLVSTAHLATDRVEQTVFLTTEKAAESSIGKGFEAQGATVMALPENELGLDIGQGLINLRSSFGVNTLLCEGGGSLAASLAAQGLVDELVYYLAPKVLGNDWAVSSFSGLPMESMERTLNFRIAKTAMSGPDLKLVLRPAKEAK